MVSPLKIELNGVLITGRLDGVENFTITFRRKDENGALSKSFSSELTFFDDGYRIIKQALIDDPLGFSKEVSVKIYDECCATAVFEGVIKGDTIDWCENDCTIKANIVEDKPEINCIKRTLIYDNHDGFMQKDHPVIRYCLETQPEFLHYAFIFVMAMLTTIGDTLLWAIQIITDIFGNSVANDIRNLRRQIASITIQCGRYHPSPYVREYIKNVCKKCGLQFKSSILNDETSQYSEYYHLVLTAAQVQKGRELIDTNWKIISQNVPIETLDTLLDNYLVPMFNADYQIEGGILQFERKDYFVTAADIWIDTNTLLSQNKIVENSVCWSWIDKERWSYGQFEYMMDASDYWGNIARGRWNDIVDWYQSPAQTGKKQVLLNAGAAHFREDELDTSVYDFLLSTAGQIILTLLSLNFYSIWSGGGLKDLLKEYKKVMLIPKHTFFSYKFLIYYWQYGPQKGRVREDYNNTFCGGDPGVPAGARFNYPMWFQEKGVGGVPLQNNLYSNFHYIDNPNLPGTDQWDYQFSFKFSCQDLATLSFNKVVSLTRNGQPRLGKIQEVTVNFINRTMAVKGIS